MRSRSFATIVLFASFVAVFACSSTSNDDTSAILSDAAVNADASTAADDSAVAQDAASGADASVAAPTGELTFKQVGSVVTEIGLGAFTPVSGSAQYRPKNVAGGVLTVIVTDATGRSIELTAFDDAGSIDANEEFAAEAPGGLALHKGRFETYDAAGKSWATEGDGSFVVEEKTATTVRIHVKNMGQFKKPGTDAFVAEGTITVPLVAFAETATGSTTLPFSAIENEPISGDAPNMTGTGEALTSTAVKLGDVSYPYVGARRAAYFEHSSGGTKRTLRIQFPSGHLPRPGNVLSLSLFDRVQVTYFEGATYAGDAGEKVWEADQGTAEVTARTATSMTIKLNGARMQSESPDAKGLFKLSGDLTFALP